MMANRKNARERRGAILILSVVIIAALLGFLAFSVDIGQIVTVKTELQNAADASVRSAIRRLPTSPDAARAAAATTAARNQIMGRQVSLVQQEDVEIGIWDSKSATFTKLSGADEKRGTAVKVTCRLSAKRGNALTLLFAHIMNRGQSSPEAYAIATLQSPFCGYIVGLDDLKIDKTYVDSYNSAVGPYDPANPGTNGHICSNDKMDLKKDTTIYGNVHYGPGESIKGADKATITGEVSELDKEIELPEIDPGDTKDNNDNDKIPIPIGSKGKSAIDKKGKFKLKNKEVLELPPGVYYFEEFTTDNKAELIISGPTVIYVEDKVKLDGIMKNLRGKPSDFQIYCMGKKVDVKNDSDTYASIYAPHAKVKLHGKAEFYGMVVGEDLDLKAKYGGIHVDESLALLEPLNSKVKMVQ